MDEHNICGAAESLIAAHPGQATNVALKRAIDYLAVGNLASAAAWSRVAALVSDLEMEDVDGRLPV